MGDSVTHLAKGTDDGEYDKADAYIDWVAASRVWRCFKRIATIRGLRAARGGKFSGIRRKLASSSAFILFLAGISCALVTDKLRRKESAPTKLLAHDLARGEVFLLGLLFRMQEYLLGLFHAPWTDLLRVDILNIIGLSLMMAGWVPDRGRRTARWIVSNLANRSIEIALAATAASLSSRHAFGRMAAAQACVVAGVLHNGVHTFGTPQSGCSRCFRVGVCVCGIGCGISIANQLGATDGNCRHDFGGCSGLRWWPGMCWTRVRCSFTRYMILAQESEFFPHSHRVC